jgi:signal transduction histidine kinase
LRLDLASGARVEVDLERFRRVLINLLDNACQAMVEQADGGPKAGDRTITLRSRSAAERVEVSISDTGPGMPAAVLAKAFEPLFSTRSFGVGLGLPMVRQIIEQHGGGVKIANMDGGGTEVSLWLPLRHGKIGAAA